jgi:diguanylate cyclase (GGDEF)-like protein
MMSTRGRSYAALGGLLALGAPLGLLALRAAGARDFSARWLLPEVVGNAAIYLYVGLSTVLAFSLFGGALGRQVDRLQELARTDALTGLLNRRAIQDRFEEEFARAARHRLPLSVLMVDVDRLTELNDREGHRRGDVALQETAAALRRGSRIEDVCARWGGDEFVVLAPGAGRDEALHLAERIRVTAASDRPERRTVSIGVATLDPGQPCDGPHALLSQSDAALYEAKALGRNRVVSR